MHRGSEEPLSHNRTHIVQGFGNTDLQFLVEVVLFGGEVEGHGGPPGQAVQGEMITKFLALSFLYLPLTDLSSRGKLTSLYRDRIVVTIRGDPTGKDTR